MIVVTHHAVERYIERVNGSLTWDQAHATIQGHSRAIAVAASFGCDTVRLGNGATLILAENRVVTVLSKGEVNLALSVPLATRKLPEFQLHHGVR